MSSKNTPAKAATSTPAPAAAAAATPAKTEEKKKEKDVSTKMEVEEKQEEKKEEKKVEEKAEDKNDPRTLKKLNNKKTFEMYVKTIGNPELFAIEMKNFDVKLEGFRQLLTPLMKVGQNIVTLNLENNGLFSENSTPDHYKELNAYLRSTQSLVTLILKFNRMGDSVVHLVDGLYDNYTITRLDLSLNEIKDAGAIALSKIFSNPNSVLTDLQFRHNKITDAGCKAFCKALVPTGIEDFRKDSKKLAANNNSLAVLNLWNNCIGNGAGEALRDLVACHPSLQNLNIADNNNMTDTVGTALFEGIGIRHDVMRSVALYDGFNTLNVSHCGFSDGAAAGLAKALENNHSLVSINFDRNTLNKDTGGNALCAALVQNHYVTELTVGLSYVDNACRDKVNQFLKINKEIAEERNKMMSLLSGGLKSEHSIIYSSLFKHQLYDAHVMTFVWEFMYNRPVKQM